ncbi:MAG: hypothetical protein JWP45_3116 [Mucilaginibacter sp.]|nr:hypothetical protein [Mucilaginibacter sp.]
MVSPHRTMCGSLSGMLSIGVRPLRSPFDGAQGDTLFLLPLAGLSGKSLMI